MAFGPAVLPGVQVGRRVAMILVAKDSTGKVRTSSDDLTLARTLNPNPDPDPNTDPEPTPNQARTSGDDALRVEVTSPSGETNDVLASVLDYMI